MYVVFSDWLECCVLGFCLGPHGGVEDVPGGRVEDVPGEGVEDIPDGRRTNYSSGLNQPEQEGDEKQDEEPVVQPPGKVDNRTDLSSGILYIPLKS